MFIRRFTSLSALVVVTQVRLGNAGRNSLRGPRLLNLDFGLFRDFAIVERVHPQFRAEAFNFTNTPHRGCPPPPDPRRHGRAHIPIRTAPLVLTR